MFRSRRAVRSRRGLQRPTPRSFGFPYGLLSQPDSLCEQILRRKCRSGASVDRGGNGRKVDPGSIAHDRLLEDDHWRPLGMVIRWSAGKFYLVEFASRSSVTFITAMPCSII